MPPQVSPITLSFGSAKLLNGPQMLEYFRPENLEVEGLDPAFLTQGGTLPDGLYSISITAYEYDAARGHRQVSNTGYGFFAVYLGLPPIIQAPKDGAVLPEMAVQNIMFQWLPRTAALPGGDGTQAYQFELFEVGPGEDAQQLANGSLTKVFTTTTSQPYLLYNPALANAPPLKPGGQYAIRVHVVSTDPSSQSYQNKGYSQVVSFSYGTPCLPPTGISMALSNYLYDKISWLPQTGATGYTVQYKTNDATEWQSQELFSNFFENYNPKQAKTYQYKVMSRCSENRTSEAVNTSRSQSIKPSCQPPTDIVVTQTDQPNTVKLSWAAVAGAKDYTIHVKKGMLQGVDEYTTDKVTKDITYTSKSFNADIRTNCTNGTSSSYISASQYIPTSQQVKQASQEAFLKSVEVNTTSTTNPIDILNPFDIVVNSEGVTDEQVEAEIEKIKNPNEAIQTPCGAAKRTETECDPVPNNYSGTETFAPVINKYMYINGYEILITSPTEGLLYLPLIKSRVPVEWSGLTVKKGPASADYGCITAGQVQMQGSQSGVISGDLYRQVMALLTQGPGSFSGKFGEAVKLISQQGDSLQRGQTINWALAKGALEASKDGFEKWRTETQNYFTKEGGSLPQEVQTILSQMQALQTELARLSSCVVQNIPPSESKKTAGVRFERAFFVCELTTADIAKMKGLEAEMEEMAGNLQIWEIESIIGDPLSLEMEKVVAKAVELSKKYYVNELGELVVRKGGIAVVGRYLMKVLGVAALVLDPVEIGHDPYDFPEYREQIADDLLDARHPGDNTIPTATDVKPKDKGPRRYVTYIKAKLDDSGIIYSGRTSGPINMTDEQIVKLRDIGHHKNNEFGANQLFKGSNSKYAIRGLEQQMIDYHGCAKSDGGISGNEIRGISRFNPKCLIYHTASNLTFGSELHEQTCTQNCK